MDNPSGSQTINDSPIQSRNNASDKTKLVQAANDQKIFKGTTNIYQLPDEVIEENLEHVVKTEESNATKNTKANQLVVQSVDQDQPLQLAAEGDPLQNIHQGNDFSEDSYSQFNEQKSHVEQIGQGDLTGVQQSRIDSVTPKGRKSTQMDNDKEIDLLEKRSSMNSRVPKLALLKLPVPVYQVQAGQGLNAFEARSNSLEGTSPTRTIDETRDNLQHQYTPRHGQDSQESSAHGSRQQKSKLPLTRIDTSGLVQKSRAQNKSRLNHLNEWNQVTPNNNLIVVTPREQDLDQMTPDNTKPSEIRLNDIQSSRVPRKQPSLRQLVNPNYSNQDLSDFAEVSHLLLSPNIKNQKGEATAKTISFAESESIKKRLQRLASKKSRQESSNQKSMESLTDESPPRLRRGPLAFQHVKVRTTISKQQNESQDDRKLPRIREPVGKLPFISANVGYQALQTTNFNNPHTTKNRYDFRKQFEKNPFGVNKSLDAHGLLQESFGILGGLDENTRALNKNLMSGKPKRLTFQQKQQRFQEKLQQSLEINRSLLNQQIVIDKSSILQKKANVSNNGSDDMTRVDLPSHHIQSSNWNESIKQLKQDHILRVTARSPDHHVESDMPWLNYRGLPLIQGNSPLNSRQGFVSQSLNASALEKNQGLGAIGTRNDFKAQLTFEREQRHLSYQQSPRQYSPHLHDRNQLKSLDKDESTASIQLVHQIIKDQADRKSKDRLVPWPGCHPTRHAQVLIQGKEKQIHAAPYQQVQALLSNLDDQQKTTVIQGEAFPNIAALVKIGSMQQLEKFGEDLQLDGPIHTENSLTRDDEETEYKKDKKEIKDDNLIDDNRSDLDNDDNLKLMADTRRQQVIKIPTKSPPSVPQERGFDNTMTSDTLSALGRLDMGSKMQHSSPLKSPPIREEDEQKAKQKKGDKKQKKQKVKKQEKAKEPSPPKQPYWPKKSQPKVQSPLFKKESSKPSIQQEQVIPSKIQMEPVDGLQTVKNQNPRESAKLLTTSQDIVYGSESKRSLMMNPNKSSEKLDQLRSLQEQSQQQMVEEFLSQQASSLDLSLQKENTKSLKNLLSGMEEKTKSLRNILSDMNNKHLSQLNSNLLSEVLGLETNKDSKVKLTKILNRSDLPKNRKVDIKQKNHTIDIEYQVSRFRHLRTITEVENKVIPFADHKMPKRHNQKALMMAISRYQGSKQSRLTSELHYYKRELDKFEKVLNQSVSPRRLENIPSVQVFDGQELINQSEQPQPLKNKNQFMNIQSFSINPAQQKLYQLKSLAKQKSSTGAKDSDVNDTFSMLTTQQLFKNNMISNVVQEAPYIEEENSVTNAQDPKDKNISSKLVLDRNRGSLVYVVQSGDNEGDELLDREPSAHQTVLGKQFPTKVSSTNHEGFKITQSKFSNQTKPQRPGIASIFEDDNHINLGKSLQQPKQQLNFQGVYEFDTSDQPQKNLEIVGLKTNQEASNSLKEEDRIAENLLKVKKAAQLAVTQANFDRRSSSPGKSKFNAASLNQDLLDDLEGKHMETEARMKRPAKLQTGRASPSMKSQTKKSAIKSPNRSPLSKISQHSANRSPRSPALSSSPMAFRPLTKIKAKIVARQSPKQLPESSVQKAGSNHNSGFSKPTSNQIQTLPNFNQLSPGVKVYLPESSIAGQSSQPGTLVNATPENQYRGQRTIIITQEPTPPESQIHSTKGSPNASKQSMYVNVIKESSQQMFQGIYGSKVAQQQQRMNSNSPKNNFSITPAPKFIIKSLQRYQQDQQPSQSRLIQDLNSQHLRLVQQQQDQRRKRNLGAQYKSLNLKQTSSTLDLMKKLNQQSKSRVKLIQNN